MRTFFKNQAILTLRQRFFTNLAIKICFYARCANRTWGIVATNWSSVNRLYYLTKIEVNNVHIIQFVKSE